MRSLLRPIMASLLTLLSLSSSSIHADESNDTARMIHVVVAEKAQSKDGEAIRKPVRVYVDMVADLFHAGHVQFLEQALAMGDELIVGLVGDEAASGYKRKPILTLDERMRSVGGCRYVTEVIGNCPMQVTKELIEEYDIDIVVHGDDFTEEKMRYYYGVPLEMGIFRSVPYTSGISSTDIIQRIKDMDT
ncbi:Uncharacterized protein SCG7109_AO_00260 [Chlamydiales bacterium SCGC AG-110-M15]|nr:Uncharacterized protein SCG7109_AO_00260 [Chlamydiales bacterium SCGC AG-110-M15]